MIPALATLLSLALFFSSGLLAANNAGAASIQPDLAGPLRKTVANLAEKEKRPAGEYARMAEETISFGSNPEAVSQFKEKDPHTQDPHAPWRNMVNDALTGVDEGERLDPKAANWPELRDKLTKLQPPPPPPSQGGSKKDKQDKNKDKKKEQKGSGKDKQQQPSGGGQKSDPSQGGEGKESEGESQGSPSQGQPGKGNKKSGQEQGGSEGTQGEGQQNQEPSSGGKDPNQIRDFSTSKEGEGQMKERGRNEQMKGMEDEKAGFGNLGQSKKDGKEQESAGVGQGRGKEQNQEAPPGMRVVGGGTGQKSNEKAADPLTLESMARLDQVRQSDSPAILQQRLQPQDQRPAPSSMGKPW